jgi:glycine oxidase
MMSLVGAGLQRPVFGYGGYLVPRPHDRLVIAGSTSEAVGFEVGTTDDALLGFRRMAGALVPALARADEARTWSGLRPMTLDGMPVIGRDPDVPRIVYAAGHSRNGVLLAPLTGEVVADLLTDSPTGRDLSPFRPDRFGRGTAVKS